MQQKKYVCIDVGGIAIKYGLADEAGNFFDKGTLPTEAETGGGTGIVAKLKRIVGRYGASQHLDGIVVATAGIVDAARGVIVYAFEKYLPGYTATPLKAILEKEFSLPCAVENDVNCAALGELWLGAGRGRRSLFCITVGTSIGGCAVYDGKVVHGASGSAGEIAYMRVPGGMLHELASTTRLIEDVTTAKRGQAGELDGKRVFELAKQGDADAQTAVKRFSEHLADGMTNVAAVLNPESIILGGGIMAQESYLRPLLEDALRQRLPREICEKTELAFAKLGNDAGMLGALYFLLHDGNAPI